MRLTTQVAIKGGMDCVTRTGGAVQTELFAPGRGEEEAMVERASQFACFWRAIVDPLGIFFERPSGDQ